MGNRFHSKTCCNCWDLLADIGHETNLVASRSAVLNDVKGEFIICVVVVINKGAGSTFLYYSSTAGIDDRSTLSKHLFMLFIQRHIVLRHFITVCQHT